MPVYWSMLIATGIIGVLGYTTKHKKFVIEGNETTRIHTGLVIILVAYIVFFVGFRDRVLDTENYIASFNAMPTSLEDIFTYLNLVDNGQGFYLLQGLFKIYISQNYYVWLFFLASISCFFFFRTLYKYSIDFSLSAYLFIASTTFTWLLNGTRQFLVVCILFGFVDWLIDGKKICYILLSILLTTFHVSAIFMTIIVLFISSKELFAKKMFVFIILTVIGTYYSETVFDFLSTTSESLDYSTALGMAGGSSIIRLFVTVIPISIVVLNFKNVKSKAPDYIKLAVNMSLIGSCFYFAASFTNGILVGRMPIYFTVYNLYLLPWVIRNCFTRQSQKLVWLLCVVFYFIYFYYQMYVAWGGLIYVSDFLKLEFL